MGFEHLHFDLEGKVILQKVAFDFALKGDYTMNNEACFFHILEGRSQMYSPKERIDLEGPQSIVMKCGSYLNSWFECEKGKSNEAVLVHFHPDVLRLVFEDEMPQLLKSGQMGKSNAMAQVRTNDMIDNYVNSLIFYFENPGLVTDELLKLKVKELILLLVQTEESERLLSILKDLFNPNEYRFKEIIHAHLYDDLSLNDLAVICGMSLSSFKRKFKAVFETSTVDYIRTKRLEKASELLKNKDNRISDIAFDCGYNDVGYFSKIFSAAFECSPSEYRKKELA